MLINNKEFIYKKDYSMDEENIITIPYDEVDESLKDAIRDHFRNDGYFLEDDWYEFSLEHIEEKYSGQIEIDKKSISFDMYRNDFNWEGYFSFKHKDNKKFIPVKYYEYVENEWVYFVNGDFKDGVINRYYSVDTDIIYQDVEEMIFGKQNNFDFHDETIEIPIDFFKPIILQLRKKENLPNWIVEKIDHWLDLINASELFFQNTIEIDKADKEDIVSDYASDLEKEVTDFMENEFYPMIDDFLTNVYDEWVDSMKKEYEYNYSDEYADQILSDREFQVVVDEQGKQIEVVELGGE